jgi:acetyltransferase
VCPADAVPVPPDAQLRAQAVIDAARAAGRPWLDAVQAAQVLQAYGIPIVATRAASSAEEAASVAQEIGFPVALKIRSRDVLHKSDIGGVVLGLTSADAVRAQAQRMRERVLAVQPKAHIEGYTVQAMAQRPGARELIVGVAADAVFGPVLLCGAGGVEVELKAQHAVGLPPLNVLLADELVTRAGLGPLLAAWRGRPAGDRHAVLDTLLRVSQMACDLPALAELDINPLLVDHGGVLALDGRIRVHLPGTTVAPLAVMPYPRQLEETITLRGASLRLRPIRPEDGERLSVFYAGASAEDLRLRFFTSRREVPRTELARFSQIDYDREMTFIALAPAAGAGGDERLVGEVRASCDPDNRTAEFGLIIAGDWQGRGLGTALMEKMIRHLRARGTGQLVGQCRTENTAMASLARRLGFVVSAGELADSVLSLRLPLQPG